MGTRNHPLKTYNPVRREKSIHYLLIRRQDAEILSKALLNYYTENHILCNKKYENNVLFGYFVEIKY